MNTAFILAAFVVAFCMAFYSYRRGLKDGLSINNGAKTIEPVKTPVSTFKEFFDERKQGKTQDEFMQAAMNIMTFDENTMQKNRGETS